MKRALILGSPGAGKSTFAHGLAQQAGLPLFHMDKLHWLPGWIERDRDEARKVLLDVLAQDRWIIDGNYGSSLPLRLDRADLVVWLDYPTILCLGRVFKRWWQYRGQTRPDMTDGCTENLNFEFLHYVLTFRRAWQARNAAALANFSGEVIRFSSPAQAEKWLRDWRPPV